MKRQNTMYGCKDKVELIHNIKQKRIENSTRIVKKGNVGTTLTKIYRPKYIELSKRKIFRIFNRQRHLLPN